MGFFKRGGGNDSTAEPPDVRAAREAVVKDPIFIFLKHHGEAATIELIQESVALSAVDASRQGQSVTEIRPMLEAAFFRTCLLFDAYYREKGLGADEAPKAAAQRANEMSNGFGLKYRAVSADLENYRQKILAVYADFDDGAMVDTLYTQAGVGLNDLVINRIDGRQYWISTLRFPEAGWQTGIFDRSLGSWLTKPFFRVNEMENAPAALINHIVAIAVVAEVLPAKWPRGMHWNRPEQPEWVDQLVAVEARLNEKFTGPTQNGDPELKALYSEVRSKYLTEHLYKSQETAS